MSYMYGETRAPLTTVSPVNVDGEANCSLSGEQPAAQQHY